MTKVYELPNGHRLVADFDENGIAKVTVQALDSLIRDLNYYADECKEYESIRRCDCCGVRLTHNNNKCGYELCDVCNDMLEKNVKGEPDA